MEMRFMIIANVIIAIIISCIYSADAKERVSLEEAVKLVSMLQGESIQSFTLGLQEFTTDELWKRMGIQIFAMENSFQVYLIKDGKAVQLQGSFGGHGLDDFCVSDLNADKKPELVYIYSYGSGVLRSSIVGYSGDNEITANFRYRGLIGLHKINDKEIELRDKYFSQDGKFVIGDLIGVLRLIDKKEGKSFDVELSRNLSPRVQQFLEAEYGEEFIINYIKQQNSLPKGSLTKEHFYFLKKGISYDDVKSRVGDADSVSGTSMRIFTYRLNDGTAMFLNFCSDNGGLVFAFFQEQDGNKKILIK